MKREPTCKELLSVIRAKCRECSSGSTKEVQRCKIDDCPLWSYRQTYADDPARRQRQQKKGKRETVRTVQLDMFDMTG